MAKYLIIIFLFLFDASAAFADKKLVVLLDWFANPTQAPLFIAKEKGYFKAHHLDVELIGPADPSDPPKLVAANKADIALTYEPQFIHQQKNNLPLVRIGTVIDKPLNCLVVLQDSGIQSIHDLKGKRVGHSTSSITGITLKTMLENNKLHLSDVTQINVNYNLTQALLSGRVDAVTGVMRTFEVIQLELAGHPARIFLPEKNGVPTYSELIIVVNKAFQNDPRFPEFLAALKEAVADIKQNPESDWKLFAKTHPEIDNTLNHRAWFATLPYFANDPAKSNENASQKLLQFMRENHVA